MIRNGIYATNSKKEKPVARILATVFAILALLLIVFIVWSAASFKDGTREVFVPQAQEISELKVQVETQAKTIDALRAEIMKLEEALVEAKKKTAELIQPEETPAEEGKATEVGAEATATEE